MVSKSQPYYPKRQQASQYILHSMQRASIQGFQIVCFTAQQFSQRLHHHMLVIEVCLLRSARTDGAGGGSVLWRQRRVLWVSVGGQEDTQGPQNDECAAARSYYPRLLYQLWICWYESQQCLPSLQCRVHSYSCQDTQRCLPPIIKPVTERESRGREEEMTKTLKRRWEEANDKQQLAGLKRNQRWREREDST